MEQYKAKMLIRVVQRIIRAVTKDIKRMRSNYLESGKFLVSERDKILERSGKIK